MTGGSDGMVDWFVLEDGGPVSTKRSDVIYCWTYKIYIFFGYRAKLNRHSDFEISI